MLHDYYILLLSCKLFFASIFFLSSVGTFSFLASASYHSACKGFAKKWTFIALWYVLRSHCCCCNLNFCLFLRLSTYSHKYLTFAIAKIMCSTFSVMVLFRSKLLIFKPDLNTFYVCPLGCAIKDLWDLWANSKSIVEF